MLLQLAGTRDGVRWPKAGQVKELPDREGAKLCAAGYAEPVVEKREETATPKKRVEKRAG